MGNRVVVLCKDDGSTEGCYSPGVYLHWGGDDVIKYIKEASQYMRKGDPLYAIARFCGVCHEEMEEKVLGLGLVKAPRQEDIEDGFEEYSPGDAGVVVINTDSGELEAFAGYLKENSLPTITFAM